MIQRDHVTASHEFRSIRTQLTETVESASQPKETLTQLKATITTMKESFETMRKELRELKAAAGGQGGTGKDVGSKLETFQNDIRKIKESVETQTSQQRNVK